jgi:hypothetical protein
MLKKRSWHTYCVLSWGTRGTIPDASASGAVAIEINSIAHCVLMSEALAMKISCYVRNGRNSTSLNTSWSGTKQWRRRAGYQLLKAGTMMWCDAVWSGVRSPNCRINLPHPSSEPKSQHIKQQASSKQRLSVLCRWGYGVPSEKLVPINQPTRRHTPENSTLHTHRRKNLSLDIFRIISIFYIG